MEFSSFVHLFLFIILISTVLSKDLSGVYLVESNEECDLKGPFIFDHQRSSVAIRFGTTQIGVGSIDKDDRLDFYLNKNRCKGLWKTSEQVAELKCQNANGNLCLAKLRCVSGECQQSKGNKNISTNKAETTLIIGRICVFLSTVFLLLFS